VDASPPASPTLPRSDGGAPFLRFWTSSTVSAAGSALTAVAIPIIAVQQLGATPAQMGLLFAAAGAASTLTRLPAATWADRSSEPLRVVAAGQFLSGVLIAAVPTLAILSLLSYVSLVAVVAAVSVLTAVVEAFAAPTLPLLVPRSGLPSAYGRVTASRSGAHVAGPAIGGMLLQILAAPMLLILDALSFFIASLLMRSVHVAPAGTAPRAGPSPEPADLWAIFRVPFLRRWMLVVLYVSLANGASSALLVLFMVRELGLQPFAVGIVLGAGAIGGVLAGSLIGAVHARIGASGTARLAGALLVGSLAGLPLAQPGWSGVAACLLYEGAGSFGAALMVITIISEIPTRIAPSATARAMALANLIPELAATIGALAGGSLASATSVRTTLWGSLTFAVMASVLTFLAAGHARARARRTQLV
jgi:predicted MFS family arabinose efflux permease